MSLPRAWAPPPSPGSRACSRAAATRWCADARAATRSGAEPLLPSDGSEEAPAPPAFCLRAAFSRSRSMACAFHFRISSTFGEALEKPPYRAMPPLLDTPGGGAGERCAAPYEVV